MHNTAHLMETALRVLAGVSVRRFADPHDVEELVKFAGPQPEGMELDEFACTVIQKVLRERAAMQLQPSVIEVKWSAGCPGSSKPAGSRPMQCPERLRLEQDCRNASATPDAAVQKWRERIGVCTLEEFLRLSHEWETASRALSQIRQDMDRHIQEHCCLTHEQDAR
jgi:hypothetical protein